MIASATPKIERTKTSNILGSFNETDRTAVQNCLNTYGNFVWALARKFTSSTVAAEIATEEIFIDIWRHCEIPHNTQLVEKRQIAMIAMRRLIRPIELAG